RGLAARDFERRFQLADYIVVADADLADGLLSISLKREIPDALKPRRIEINTSVQPDLLQSEKAA
ncbi:Hsp20 family protein, partial [Phenylobacterium sp.]|uniref:Hsp20 family protein n=1 Tax=Phenylobacterium sp. TaxID=1871053 RepID=UPI0037C666D4